MSRFFVWNRRYSKMKQEQDKSIRTVKSISKNVLEVKVYYSSFNLLYFRFGPLFLPKNIAYCAEGIAHTIPSTKPSVV
ncbi:Uncharacterised protein [Streptococcus pneumoniae]|nr:Uncharacterised protein [Streptococcus pneumoniae]